ncbi:uncharacterized protein ColSpa_01368 [Colletotrichum spaethianum]|uniref:Uncharacterized protein n=1 Tax=Colletotrichum spaethianum TaxID=700344 RepID=A0AA37LBA2_9PEZI|nr:uncharacterized protein ColSpa_01368 [Colletotrichum spaethianum]GKT41187.1 hypothetical protein ColSpa_01368 [Colletotrichum spaethianum]
MLHSFAVACSRRFPVRRDIRTQVFRSAVPANILLTIYGVLVDVPGTTIVVPGTTIVGPSTTIVIPPTAGIGPSATIAGTGVTPLGPTTVPLPVVPSGTLAPGQPTTVFGPDGALVTVTSVVTTITYTTVDPVRPTALSPVELCTTLYFEDCHCPVQAIPEVPMATYEAQCDRCGLVGRALSPLLSLWISAQAVHWAPTGQHPEASRPVNISEEPWGLLAALLVSLVRMSTNPQPHPNSRRGRTMIPLRHSPAPRLV